MPTLTASAATLDSEPSTRISTCAGLPGLELPRVVRGDLDPDAGPAGDQGLGQVLVGEDLADDLEVLGVLEPLEQDAGSPACRAWS